MIPFIVVAIIASHMPALEAKNVFLLVNQQFPAGSEIAKYYCKQRTVPIENIIFLDVPNTEDISRSDYNTKIIGPVRVALKEKKEIAKVLVSIHGMPLRVGGATPNSEQKAALAKLDPQIKQLQTEVDREQKEAARLEMIQRLWAADPLREIIAEKRNSLRERQAELQKVQQRRGFYARSESHACVDSELMLMWWDDYELQRWIINPLHWQFPAKVRDTKPRVMMTSRLDGPTPELVRRLIDDAIETEKLGLSGKVYVDARGIRYDPKGDPGQGYGGYDESMREMAILLEKEGKMTVVLDDKPDLFKPDTCTECALYCGWYSHATFIDCCRFTRGAVAWHLASSEAVSLRRADVKYWCKNLLEKGACATLGPVAEPYTIGFPKPAEFFGFLATGKYTLVECYARTVMLTSWMGCLVGDPLYNPYGKTPKLKENVIFPSPRGGRIPFRME